MTGDILNHVLHELEHRERVAKEAAAAAVSAALIDHSQSGWDSLDWDHVIEAGEAAQDMAADLNHAVNGGGGACDPQRLREIAAKAESVAAELRAICARYR